MDLSSVFKKIKAKISSPPAHLLQASRNFKATLASDWREILLVDAIIMIFLIASVHQLAFVFGRGEATLIGYIKAIGIDGSIWLISRAIAKRMVSEGTSALIKGAKSKVAVQSKWTGITTHVVLWTGLLLFIAATTYVNTQYELWDRSLPVGQVGFTHPESLNVLATQTISSSFLALIILFLTFVRALLQKNMVVSFFALKQAEQEEHELAEKRKKQREYARRNREKMKAVKKSRKPAKKRAAKKSRGGR